MSKQSVVLPMVLALLLFSCSRNNNLSGVVTETTNGSTVSGIVSDDQGSGSNAKVTLIPNNYIPINDTSFIEVQTDESGNYKIDEIPIGKYHLFATNSDGNIAKSSLLNIDTSGLLINQDLFLNKPASILVGLDSINVDEGNIVYIPGTNISNTVDSSEIINKVIAVNDVPPGEYQSIIILDINDFSQTDILTDTLNLNSEDTTIVGRIRKFNFEREFVLDLTSLNLSESLLNYPLLVRLGFDELDLRLLQTNAEDLRFLNSKSDSITFEIERWEVYQGEGLVWLLIDTIPVNEDSIQFKMLWGNDTIPAPTFSQIVFDTSMGYKGVYHFQEFYTDSFGAKDGSNEYNHGSIHNQMDDSNIKPSVIGNGIGLSGDSSYFAGQNVYDNPLNFSFSLWFKTMTNSGGVLVEFVNDPMDTLQLGWRWDRKIWMSDAGNIHFGVFQDSIIVGSRPEIRLSSSSSYNDDQWHFVSASLTQEGIMELWVDDNKIGDTTNAIPAIFNGQWRLGTGRPSLQHWEPIPTSMQFEGFVDEFRIYNRPRNSLRNSLDFHSQKPNSKLIRFN